MSAVNIEDHLALVRRLASRLARKLPPCFDRDDLIQEGMIGLIQAAARWDPSVNDNFRNYATPRIQGAMLDSIRRRHWLAAKGMDLAEVSAILSEDSGEVIVLDYQEAMVLKGLKRKLTGRKQMLLRLIYGRGLTPRRAAAIMRLNLPQFEALHQQALNLLRFKLVRKASA
jgi:RNA polymerase sigma factor (sigma-70 family)